MMKGYETVIGLEVHVELKTESKIFCSCATDFGKPPNTQCCPVCLGLPGSLPVLNEKVIEFAILAGLATNCQITRQGKQDRKNYFYPDLPKAYQISQYDMPLCLAGYVDIIDEAATKRINITRIHIEEDAGKLTHDKSGGTMIDYNRCGVPLIEIVSEPDLRSANEAISYLRKLRAILLYADVSDCKMNEGSFRCDVNVSVRKMGEKTLGTRTEMKNLNSFSSITRAIEHESLRQIKAIESGSKIVQETRRWDQDKNKSTSMRSKEDAHDYRYFCDPDLMPIHISEETIQACLNMLPVLPDQRKDTYCSEYQISPYHAEQIVSNKELADFFEQAVTHTSSPVLLANFIISQLLKKIGDTEEEVQIPVSPEDFASLIKMISDGKINASIGKKVLDKMWKEQIAPEEIIERDNLWLIVDETILSPIIEKVIQGNQKTVDDYLRGKEKALQSLVGQIMRETNGKAEPEITMNMLRSKIKP